MLKRFCQPVCILKIVSSSVKKLDETVLLISNRLKTLVSVNDSEITIKLEQRKAVGRLEYVRREQNEQRSFIPL